MKIEYKLVGTGWAECTLITNDQACTITASYLSDALANLVQATTSILKGSHSEKISFDEEPGEYRLLLTATSPNELNIRILEFNELWGDKPDLDGKEIFLSTATVREFAIALKATLDTILEDIGLSGYKEKWHEHEFPIEYYKELCLLLSSASII